ncbi:Late embryogenesis abundant protein, LEA-14 [Artemisia annua]|uniref:Late embryogenesis abundant protein, LEA-14 n=1 Tax=Artemisia annua TaxID=35608 RepID=A0A2U1QML6_ARTAN|nr:Late embryogenesis abundant protein, LEA-14 [Artemisia annua]
MADHNTINNNNYNRPVTGYPAPAANGYPYAAPPPQPNSSYFNVSSTNPNYYPNPNYNQQRVTFLRRIFAVLVASVIIFGTIIFIMWLILRPQVPQFRVQSFTLSNFNESNNLVTGNWDASLDVRNPNDKIVLYYDHLEAAVFYKGESIAVTTVAPFMQGKKNETSVKASFAALNAYVNYGNGIKGSGSVEFNLRMVARVRFKAGAWWARRRILRIYCPDLNLPVGGVGKNSTGGSLSGGAKNCRVAF